MVHIPGAYLTVVQHEAIINNYSLKWRWIFYRGKYQPLATDTEVNSRFSIS